MDSDGRESERRTGGRRWVMMRVMVDDQETVQFTNTVNVSDSGLLLERQSALDLVLDQHVNVVIEGMLSDEAADPEAAPDEGRAMMVVRISDEHVALTFLP